MLCLVFCTFDLKGASAQNYKDAYTDLEKIGLRKVHKHSDGSEAVIPTTAAMGGLNGISTEAVVTTVRDSIRAAFKARGFKSEVFLIAGGDGRWTGTTT
jgi:hypothetical protein